MNSVVQDFLGLKKVETYHGHDIYIGSFGGDILNNKVTFSVHKNGKPIFNLPCLVSDMTLMDQEKVVPVKVGRISRIDSQQAQQIAQDILSGEGLKRVRGIIDLGRFEEGKPCEDYWITFEEKSGSLSDSQICDELLRALYRIRRWCPEKYEYEHIDVDGFCDVLGISRNEYLFNAKYLLEEKLIHEAPSDQLLVDDGYIYITNTGIDMIHKKNNYGLKSGMTEEATEQERSAKYDVALSFAGEDRQYAEELARLLESGGYSVFYDKSEQVSLWGKNLYDHLSQVYKDEAKYCVMFLSKDYERKLWTNHERRSAQARAFQESEEYILPVRIDDTEIPGILPTVGYLDLNEITIQDVYKALIEKLSE